ncbi:MAG: acyl-CoA dehydrogenase family protein, partial [Chloroflexi bacterium]|nr:acyl-CoA dehydrogenase family protein [Chloroflexota bacterium]
MSIVLTDEQKQMVSTIRDFVARDVIPYASDLEHADEYPSEMVEKG